MSNDNYNNGSKRLRHKCIGCNLLVNLDRVTVTDDGIRCLKCAPDESEPWYVDTDSTHD